MGKGERQRSGCPGQERLVPQPWQEGGGGTPKAVAKQQGCPCPAAPGSCGASPLPSNRGAPQPRPHSVPSPSPCPAGAVTEVKTDIYVTSFGPVSDVEMVRAPLAASALFSRDSLRWHLS